MYVFVMAYPRSAFWSLVAVPAHRFTTWLQTRVLLRGNVATYWYIHCCSPLRRHVVLYRQPGHGELQIVVSTRAPAQAASVRVIDAEHIAFSRVWIFGKSNPFEKITRHSITRGCTNLRSSPLACYTHITASADADRSSKENIGRAHKFTSSPLITK